ncbi:MFS transporter [Tautonia rosea]|uniref:MFS transporter n=1 Tax=Tautonia rosea TaxID=2728037 RepID=UPI00147439F7|nr:MFS transporter [Tautonia rosea]
MEYGTFFLFAQQADASSGFSLGNFLPFSALHFLQFAIWGAWYVVLGNYLNAKGFTRASIGRIYGTMPLGAIISPMLLATVADKYLNMEVVIGLSHLIGAALLVVMSQVNNAKTFFWVALAYALVYSPTLSLANAVVFPHLNNPNHFPYIRVFGTLGWIAAGLSLKVLIKPDQPMNNRPILLAAGLSLVLGVYSFSLPATPPTAEGDALPFVKAISMLSEPTFAVFFGVTLVIAMAMGIYFAFAALFIEQRAGVKSQNVGPIMTIGQAVEIFFMLSLPWFIESLGMPVVLAMGVAAWALRFGCFTAASTGGYFPLILLGVALHGLCFDFFFAAGFIHVETLSEPTIRASAQSLYGVIVYGLGMYLGTEISGWLNQRFTKEEVPAIADVPPVRKTDWRKFWSIPFVAVTLAMLAFFASLYLIPEPTVPEIDPNAEPAAVVEGEVETEMLTLDPVVEEGTSEGVEEAPAEVDETP